MLIPRGIVRASLRTDCLQKNLRHGDSSRLRSFRRSRRRLIPGRVLHAVAANPMVAIQVKPSAIQDEWAFDEAKNSSRFASQYAELGAALLEKVRNSASPEAFDSAELAVLRRVHAKRSGALIKALYGHPAYQLTQLGRTAFDRLMVWTSMSLTQEPVTFTEFAQGKRWRHSNGEPDNTDPRVLVDSQPPCTPFPSHVPPIVIARSYGLLGVIDGFGRSLLFLKLRTPVNIGAWVPSDEIANIA
jgi:hypothetical protein